MSFETLYYGEQRILQCKLRPFPASGAYIKITYHDILLASVFRKTNPWQKSLSSSPSEPRSTKNSALHNSMASNSAAARAALGFATVAMLLDIIIMATTAYATSLVGERTIRVPPINVPITVTLGYVYGGSWMVTGASSVIVLLITACSSIFFGLPLLFTAGGDEQSMDVTKSLFFGIYQLVITVFLFSSSVAALALYGDAYYSTNVNCILTAGSLGIFSSIFHILASIVGVARTSKDLPRGRDDDP